MLFGLLAIVVLGALGFLEWAYGSILLLVIDGFVCTIMERQTVPQPEIMSVQEAISDKYSIHSGIFTDYISIDISIAWLIGLIIYKTYDFIKSN